MAVPNIFGTATAAIPLSQLDTNFATPVTIGNTAVQLGNTVTSFGNVTLTNVTISSGNVTVTGANVSGTANVTTLAVTGEATVGANVTASAFTSTSTFGFKNRIINGAMVIDQRNAGASVNTAGSFAVDRWFMQRGGSAVFSLGQSTTVPAGFYNSIVATVTTAAAISSGDYYDIQQNIEGLNLLDLNWGTANAATVTLSFWVRSSVAGIYSFQLRNSASNRSIVYNYTIATANTWQQITQTIAGDTSGTWLATNGIGIGLVIPLGTGSSYTTATTGTWQAGNFNASTSALTTWQATLSNTFYITGVQLEKGSTATSFDYRPYGTELDLCYRYYFQSNQFSTYSPIGVGRAWGSGNGNAPYYLPAAMRSNPTITYSSLSHFDVVTLGNPTAIQNDGAGTNNVKVGWAKAVTSGNLYQFEFGNQTNGWLGFSAEL